MNRGLLAAFTLTSLALVAGCESGSSTGPEPIDFEPAAPPAGEGFVALYAPPVDIGPYPNDIYNLPGQTLSVPVKFTSPLARALNTLDGFSTTATISAPFNAAIDPATLVPFNPLATPGGGESVFVLDATNGVPLVPGVHYELGISAAAGTAGAILEFTPLRPLQPATTYAFILTSGIRSTAGVAASADTVFGLVRDAHLAGVMTGNPGLDALLPAVGPLIDAAVGLLGLPGSAIVSAWSVSTQTTTELFERLDAATVPRAIGAVTTRTDTGKLGLGLPGLADIHAGFLEIPYFGSRSAPLDGVWIVPPPSADEPAPLPLGEPLRIPLLATVPNARSQKTKPDGGWPVAVIQHGITRDRTVMLAMADVFAEDGFAVVAIDLPLHGVTDSNNPFYNAPGNPFGTTERHFGLDNVGQLGDYRPDGAIDDGWQILNLNNPLNARDNGRQAVADLIQLVRSLPNLDLDADGAGDIDGNRIHFVAVSLGSIFATAFVAVNDDIRTATLVSPGGPYTQFLYDPAAVDFGLPIRRAIEAQGLAFGTLGFDNFARDLQTILDPIDPMNYGAAAAVNHPIHVIGVLSDMAVPARLTDNLARVMGLRDISETAVDAAGVRGIVRYTAGGHSSIFNPFIDRAVTEEMQVQTVNFAASNGTWIPIGIPEIVQ